MEFNLNILPPQVPIQNDRAPQANIPQTRPEREEVLEKIRQFTKESALVPPIPLEELREISKTFCKDYDVDEKYLEYVAILMNNELWRETLAAIPYNRRLLLLPKCLRVEAHCPAPFDEFGLLCKKCGMCSIQDLQTEAEKLGYAVLVAEGSPIVMAIIETGKIDAIVGVSCISVLERAFPYMEAGAVPGVAIPLLQDDCLDTTVDTEWIWDVIHLTSEDRTHRMDLTGLREEVDSWFSPDQLADLLGQPETETEKVGHEWLARAGKRWRPFLTVAARQALSDDPTGDIPYDLRRVAVAVECFHKASLIHDDIEDEDETRYGEDTLHTEHGVPVALNIGDYLLGEGYRLLAESEVDAETRVKLLQAASLGHRTLCLGQGAELSWARNPEVLKSTEVLRIFERKTSPAFDVALRLGALYAGANEKTLDVIARYSRSLGLAYQVRDDLDDLAEDAEASDLLALRPTLPMAIAHERAKGDAKKRLAKIWRREIDQIEDFSIDSLREELLELGAVSRSRELQEGYKEEAIRSLWDLENPNLKGLLRRVIGKIFNDTQIKGWCNEFETRNAPSSEAGTKAAG